MKIDLSKILSILVIIIIIILSIIIIIQSNKLNNLYIKSEKDKIETINRLDSLNSINQNLIRTKIDSINTKIFKIDSIIIIPKIKYYDKQIKTIDSSGGKLPIF